MESIDNHIELLEVYRSLLETQIQNKRYFLKQAQDVISSLPSQDITDMDKNKVDPDTFQSLLEKPMFLPERSDPIGLSLMNTSMTKRIKTTQESIIAITESLEQDQQLIEYHVQMNKGLEELSKGLAKKGMEFEQDDCSNNSVDLLDTNKKLHSALNDIVTKYISTDGEDTVIANQLLERLTSYDDTLNIDDFVSSHSGSIILKILRRYNLLEENEFNVKLLEFTNERLDQ